MEVVEGYQRRRWFVSGVCGTVGAELLRQICELNPESVVGIDNNESELYYLTQKYRTDPRIKLYLCDIRSREELAGRVAGSDIVIHAAALKHVPVCEEAPGQAVSVNIQGTQNIIDAAIAAGADRVLFTSTDKAVNPTNVMGTSKLMGERLVTAAHLYENRSNTRLFSTRFGNVLGSRGSVIPIFREQIARGGPVTLTDEAMTRFIMSLSQAVRLVLDSIFIARGGEVLVTKMPSIRMLDLAKVMIEELAPQAGNRPESIKVEITGVRPGEKMYEELCNDEEIRRTIELTRYLVVRPPELTREPIREADYPGLVSSNIEKPYNSEVAKKMTKKELRQFLYDSELLNSGSAAR